MKKTLCMILSTVMVLATLVGCTVSVGAITATEAREGVVYIFSEWHYQTTDEEGEVVTAFGGSASGSGFAIGKKGKPVQYVVTNAHVVYDSGDGENPPMGLAAQVIVNFNEAAFDYVVGEVVAYDLVKDLAIIRLPEPTTKRIPLRLRESKYFDMEDSVSALGYPGIAEPDKSFAEHDMEECVITRGHVSTQTTNTDLVKVYLLDVVFSGGNSGGPLLNEVGDVIGINTYAWRDSSDQSIARYAICVDELIQILDSEKIPYWGYEPISVATILIILAAVLVVALIVVLVVLILKKGTPSPVPTRELVLMGVGGVLAGRTWSLSDPITIGRDFGSCNVVFPDGTPGISKVHCQITKIGDMIQLTDNNSTYGTFVNGMRVNAGLPVQLKENDTFYLGAPENSFRIQAK